MKKDSLREFYENDSARFWDPRGGMRGRDLHIYPLLRTASGTLLDYGAGSGSLLLALALEDRFKELIGVDLSEQALERISSAWDDMSRQHSKEHRKVKLMTPVSDTLPQIGDETVDAVLSLDTIEHVLDPYVVLDEFYRVAKPGAIFIMSVPNYGYIKYVLQLLVGRQPITGGGQPVESWRSSGWDGWHLHTFTKQSLEALLRDCGWEPESWTGYGERGSQFGMHLLRRRFPAMWSGALTVISRRVNRPS